MDDLFHEMPGAMASEQSSAVSKGFMDYVHARKNTHSRSIAERKARSDKWGFYEKADIEGLKNAFTNKKYRQHQNAMMRDEYQKAKKKRVRKAYQSWTFVPVKAAAKAKKVSLPAGPKPRPKAPNAYVSPRTIRDPRKSVSVNQNKRPPSVWD